MTNPTVLFLDDCPKRTKKFVSRYPYAKCAETAEGIIKLIKGEEQIDALFLDHDLGGAVYVDSGREDCGMEVARYLVDNKHAISRIYVHSLNRPAGLEMTSKLKDAGYKTQYIPFINLKL